MAEAQSGVMGVKSFVLSTFFATLVTLIAVAFVVSPQWLDKTIKAESGYNTDFLGIETMDAVRVNAKAQFEHIFVESGIIGWVYNLFPTEHELKEGKSTRGGVGNVVIKMHDRLNLFWYMIYQSFERLGVLLYWLPFLLVVAIPAAIDGAFQREIKRINYLHSSARLFGVGKRFVVFSILLLPAYLVFPLPVHPIAGPLWMVMFAAAINLNVANMQKHI